MAVGLSVNQGGFSGYGEQPPNPEGLYRAQK
jgi:hypothetical protein